MVETQQTVLNCLLPHGVMERCSLMLLRSFVLINGDVFVIFVVGSMYDAMCSCQELYPCESEDGKLLASLTPPPRVAPRHRAY